MISFYLCLDPKLCFCNNSRPRGETDLQPDRTATSTGIGTVLILEILIRRDRIQTGVVHGSLHIMLAPNGVVSNAGRIPHVSITILSKIASPFTFQVMIEPPSTEAVSLDCSS